MKILRYEKKERGSMIGVLDVELNLDYGSGPQPAMIRLRHFKSKKSGKEFVAFPSEKNWDHPEQKYEDVVVLLQDGVKFDFSNAVMQLISEMPKDVEVGQVEEQEFPF